MTMVVLADLNFILAPPSPTLNTDHEGVRGTFCFSAVKAPLSACDCFIYVTLMITCILDNNISSVMFV